MNAKAKGRRASGFTLVELLIAMAIALILVAGLWRFFLGQQKTFTAQDEVTRMQQKARIAEDFMLKAIQQAGAHSYVEGVTRGYRPPAILAASDRYIAVQYDDPQGDLPGTVTAGEVVIFALGKDAGGATERVADDPARSAVQVYYDANRDGEVAESEAFDLSIDMNLSSPPYNLYRITPDPAGSTNPPIKELIATNVDNLVLRYYDQNGSRMPFNATTKQPLPYSGRQHPEPRRARSDPAGGGGASPPRGQRRPQLHALLARGNDPRARHRGHQRRERNSLRHRLHFLRRGPAVPPPLLPHPHHPPHPGSDQLRQDRAGRRSRHLPRGRHRHGHRARQERAARAGRPGHLHPPRRAAGREPLHDLRDHRRERPDLHHGHLPAEESVPPRGRARGERGLRRRARDAEPRHSAQLQSRPRGAGLLLGRPRPRHEPGHRPLRLPAPSGGSRPGTGSPPAGTTSTTSGPPPSTSAATSPTPSPTASIWPPSTRRPARPSGWSTGLRRPP